jgi:hypothetical protein
MVKGQSDATGLRNGERMRHRTFLEYRGYRYLKLATLLSLIAIIVYAWFSFPVGRYGGTFVGYGLGTIGALLIVWLMWLGIQKRRYRANVNGLQGWVSAHIYLGTSLIVIATLHTGFQVGWNVHTLAYVLMLIVIFSGGFGVLAYMRLPRLMTENMGEDTLDSAILKIADVDRDIRRVAMAMPDEITRMTEASIQHTHIGGGVMAQLRDRPKNCPTRLATRFLEETGKTLKGEDQQRNHELYSLMLRKKKLVDRARADVRFKALLNLWLYFHVPISFALLAALTAHIISVFFYW